MTPRFYFPALADEPPILNARTDLPNEVAHHAARVLRLREGDAIVLFDGQGCEYPCTLHVQGNACSVTAHEKCLIDRESPVRLSLVQALAVGDKMDWVVQKAAELGVLAVQPVAAERSVLKLDATRGAKRTAHWQQIAIGASEQCGRNRIMQIGTVCTLSAWLAQPFEGERWMLDHEEGTTLSKLPRPTGPVAVLIGPEGGWSPAELELARAAGCTRVQMGPRVLRTETVGIAIAGAMMALWGDF